MTSSNIIYNKELREEFPKVSQKAFLYLVKGIKDKKDDNISNKEIYKYYTEDLYKLVKYILKMLKKNEIENCKTMKTSDLIKLWNIDELNGYKKDNYKPSGLIYKNDYKDPYC